MEFHFEVGDIGFAQPPNLREQKGLSLYTLPIDFTYIDVETTDLDPRYGSVVEVAAQRCRDGAIVDIFSSLARTTDEIDWFTEDLTGITTK